MPKKKYVLIYAHNTEAADDVLLLVKEKPEWMRGRLNLLGGKVEDGEEPEAASVREIWEEAGLISDEPHRLMGIVHFESSEIYCFRFDMNTREILRPGENEVEKASWYSWESIRNDPRLMENLKVIVPLMKCNVDSWSIFDDGDGGPQTIIFTGGSHE